MAEIETTDAEKEFLKGFWARKTQTVIVVAEHYITAQSDTWVEGFLSAGAAQPDRSGTSFLVTKPGDWIE